MTCNANLHMPLLMMCDTKLTIKILVMRHNIVGGLHAIGMLSQSNSYLNINVNEKCLDTLTNEKKNEKNI